ncbi:MAG: PA14 domain-containing protein [Kiritimatiellia bacterium]
MVGVGLASGQSATNQDPTELRYVLEPMHDATNRSGTGYFIFHPWESKGANPIFRILRPNGAEVGHQLLWAAYGEAAQVLFDCSSGDTTFHVVEGALSNASRNVWKAQAGFQLETRAYHDGPVQSGEAIKKLCDEASPVQGCSLVPNVFLGVNPHAPTENCISIFRGNIAIPKPGKYTFTVVSDGASALFIDGQHVVSWPGQHPVHGAGRLGKFQAEADLTGGRHWLEYYNVEKGLAYTVVLGWKQPGEVAFSVVPPAAFPQPAAFQVMHAEYAFSRKIAPRFYWEIERHLSSWGHYMVFVKLSALCDADEFTWTLDDGSVLKGRTVTNLYMSTGLRAVQLAASRDGEQTKTRQMIAVHPRWRQLDETDQDYWGQCRTWILARNFTNAACADLLNMLRMTSKMDDHGPAKEIAAVGLNRLAEWGPAEAGVAMELGNYFQVIEVRDYAAARRAYEDVIRTCGTNRQVKAGAQLALAASLLPVGNDFPKVQELLSSIDETDLSGDDRRLKRICEGDLFFAMGRPELAAARYKEAGTRAPQGQQDRVRSGLERQAKLETARDYIRRNEFNAAERVVANLRQDEPMQRMDGEVGLILLDACLGRNDYTRAYYLSRRLYQNCEPGPNLPALLCKLADSAFRMKEKEEAGEALQRLHKEFPYSEAAARAREKWGAPARQNPEK